MDEIADGAAPVPLSGPQELRDWLATKGIPVHKWGTGQAKRVEDLWTELCTGESVLTDSPLERHVSFVSVVIRRGDKILTEIAQELATGEIRKRQWPPGEKMLPDEDPEVAAFRCVEEELGVPRELCRIVPGTHTKTGRTGESPSYPRLVTRYSAHQIEMEVLGLPGKFETPESAESEDTAVVKHFWDWLSQP